MTRIPNYPLLLSGILFSPMVLNAQHCSKLQAMIVDYWQIVISLSAILCISFLSDLKNPHHWFP